MDFNIDKTLAGENKMFLLQKTHIGHFSAVALSLSIAEGNRGGRDPMSMVQREIQKTHPKSSPDPV